MHAPADRHPAVPGRYLRLPRTLIQQLAQSLARALALVVRQILQERLEPGLPGGLLPDPEPLQLAALGRREVGGGAFQPLQLSAIALGVPPPEPGGHPASETFPGFGPGLGHHRRPTGHGLRGQRLGQHAQPPLSATVTPTVPRGGHRAQADIQAAAQVSEDK